MDIDQAPVILERQMSEVLKSLGMGIHVVQVAIPSDSDLPPAEFTCDRDFHLGELYLFANQARLAIRRFEAALSSYAGQSAYENFEVAVWLALAECHAAIDVKEWDTALEYLDKVFKIFPDDDRGHAIRARIHVRRNEPVEAYRSAMATLKANPLNFEAACYLGLMGAHIARAQNDLEEMRKSIENLRIAQSLYPASQDLASLIEVCEHELKTLNDQSTD